METQTVQVDREKAQQLYRDYKKHAHWSRPIDKECMRAYQLIAAGRMIIQALESVRVAGVKQSGVDEGYPALGLCRADATACTAQMGHDGSCTMTADNARQRVSHHNWQAIPSRSVLSWASGTFPSVKAGRWRATALVPAAPLNLRPKRGLQNYHVLWEAQWTKIPPHDPLLLRRIGRGDLWLVVCQWDLTNVERAALSTRL
jgi:hypothetical protein